MLATLCTSITKLLKNIFSNFQVKRKKTRKKCKLCRKLAKWAKYVNFQENMLKKLAKKWIFSLNMRNILNEIGLILQRILWNEKRTYRNMQVKERSTRKNMDWHSSPSPSYKSLATRKSWKAISQFA